MHETFVPLAEFLRRPASEPPLFEAEREQELTCEPTAEDEASPIEEVWSDVRRFRAALADALDVRLERLLCDIAVSVLARELRLVPADVSAIVARELDLAGEAPVRVRVHPDDRSALAPMECEVAADPGLRRGDVAIDVRSGTISATLGCRLERALANAAT